MKKIAVLVALVALLTSAFPVFAQEETSTDIISMTVSWQQLFGSIVVILVGGGLLYVVFERLSSLVPREFVSAAVDSFERGFKAGQEKAKQTPELTDDLAFQIMEPIVAAIINLLKRNPNQELDPQLVREELTRQFQEKVAQNKS